MGLISRIQVQWLLWRLPSNAPEKLSKIGLQAVAPLLKAFSASNSLRRHTAIEACGLIQDPRVIVPLIHQLSNTDIRTRQAAKTALIQTGPPIVGPLNQALENASSGSLIYFLEILREVPDPGTVEAVVKTLDNKSCEVRMAAVECLAAIGDARAEEPLMAITNESEFDLSCRAANAVVALKGYENVEERLKSLDALFQRDFGRCEELGVVAVEPLIKALRQTDKDLRMNAAIVLGRLLDMCAIDPLRQLVDDPDSNVRSRVNEALVHLGDVEAFQRLLQETTSTESSIRDFAMSVIKGLSSSKREEFTDQSADVFRLALRNDDYQERKASAQLLLYLDSQKYEQTMSAIHAISQRDVDACVEIGEQAIDPLIGELKSATDKSLLFVAEALCRIGAKEAVEPLIETFDGKHVYRYEAIEDALVCLREHSVGPLIAALGNSANQIVEGAAKTLGKLKEVSAVEPLISLLSSDNDRSIRWYAAGALGEIGDPRAVEPLLIQLDDPDDRIQLSARHAFRNFGKAAIEPLLAFAYQYRYTGAVSDMLKVLDWEHADRFERILKSIRSGFFGESIASEGTLAIRLLIGALNKFEDTTRRRTFVRVLALIGGKTAIDEIEKCIDDKDGSVGSQAVELIGQVGTAENLQIIAHAMVRHKNEVRAACFEVLSRVQTGEHVPVLVSVLRDPETIRQLTVESLVRVGPPVVEPLLDVLNSNDIDSESKIKICRAFKAFGDGRSMVSLLETQQDEDQYVCKAASDAALQVAGNHPDSVVAALDHTDCNVRIDAIKTLGQLGDPRAAAPLIASLDDSHASVREHAIQVLGAMKLAHAVEPIIKSLNDREMVVRQMASSTLGGLMDSRAVPGLVKSLNDDSRVVRSNAARSLGLLADPKAVAPLVGCLSSHDETFRATILNSLGQIGDRRAVKAMAMCLQDPSKSVREQAALAIGVLGDMRAFPYLAKAGEKPGWLETNCFTRALGELSDPRGIGPLIAIIQKALRKIAESKEMYADFQANEVYENARTALGRILERSLDLASIDQLNLVASLRDVVRTWQSYDYDSCGNVKDSRTNEENYEFWQERQVARQELIRREKQN